MKYQNIFWLEDSPDILGDVLRICAGHGVDKAALFPQISFAPDYETGARLLQNKDFDLYILDGDFPEATSERWKKHYCNFMQQVSTNTKYLDFHSYFKDKNEDKYGDGYIGRSTNNFASFFYQFLQNRNKTIVYSISSIALSVAFHHGLPFYSKALDKGAIKGNLVRRMSDEGLLKRYFPSEFIPKKADFLDQWECGSRFDLVERYLLS